MFLDMCILSLYLIKEVSNMVGVVKKATVSFNNQEELTDFKNRINKVPSFVNFKNVNEKIRKDGAEIDRGRLFNAKEN